MKSSLIKKVMKTNLGTEYAIGIRPYVTSRATMLYTDLDKLSTEHGLELGKYDNAHVWLYNLMAHVAEIELPKKSQDGELEDLRDYWDKANDNMRHNYDLFMYVSVDVAKAISDMVRFTIVDYEASFPQMSKTVQKGKPDDPKASRTGGKQSRKK